MTPTTSTPEALATEYLDLKDRAAALDDRMKQIVTELRDTLGAGKHPAGEHSITVTPQRRFNPDHAKQVLSSNPDLLAACTETVVTSSKAKQILAPALYEACMVEAGDPRVSIR